MSSTQVTNTIERLQNEIKKLKMDAKMLHTKNMILIQQCQEHKSHKEQYTAAHQLELNLAKAPIRNLKSKIQTLEQVNRKLDEQSVKQRQIIAEYAQRHMELLSRRLETKNLHQQVKIYEGKIETLQEKNMAITDELYTLKHVEIPSKDQRIGTLRHQLHEIHDRFERKIRDNDKRNKNTMKIEISESIKTTLLSQSSTLHYSSDSGNPQFYTESPSVWSVSKSKKRNGPRRMHHMNIPPTPELSTPTISDCSHDEESVTRVSWGYDVVQETCALELDDVNSYPMFVDRSMEDMWSLSRQPSTSVASNYVKCFLYLLCDMIYYDFI
eukprot:375281_1